MPTDKKDAAPEQSLLTYGFKSAVTDVRNAFIPRYRALSASRLVLQLTIAIALISILNMVYPQAADVIQSWLHEQFSIMDFEWLINGAAWGLQGAVGMTAGAVISDFAEQGYFAACSRYPSPDYYPLSNTEAHEIAKAFDKFDPELLKYREPLLRGRSSPSARAAGAAAGLPERAQPSSMFTRDDVSVDIDLESGIGRGASAAAFAAGQPKEIELVARRPVADVSVGVSFDEARAHQEQRIAKVKKIGNAILRAARAYPESSNFFKAAFRRLYLGEIENLLPHPSLYEIIINICTDGDPQLAQKLARKHREYMPSAPASLGFKLPKSNFLLYGVVGGFNDFLDIWRYSRRLPHSLISLSAATLGLAGGVGVLLFGVPGVELQLEMYLADALRLHHHGALMGLVCSLGGAVSASVMRFIVRKTMQLITLCSHGVTDIGLAALSPKEILSIQRSTPDVMMPGGEAPLVWTPERIENTRKRMLDIIKHDEHAHATARSALLDLLHGRVDRAFTHPIAGPTLIYQVTADPDIDTTELRIQLYEHFGFHHMAGARRRSEVMRVLDENGVLQEKLEQSLAVRTQLRGELEGLTVENRGLSANVTTLRSELARLRRELYAVERARRRDSLPKPAGGSIPSAAVRHHGRAFGSRHSLPDPFRRPTDTRMFEGSLSPVVEGDGVSPSSSGSASPARGFMSAAAASLAGARAAIGYTRSPLTSSRSRVARQEGLIELHPLRRDHRRSMRRSSSTGSMAGETHVSTRGHGSANDLTELLLAASPSTAKEDDAEPRRKLGLFC